jgi:hypothetical protein
MKPMAPTGRNSAWVGIGGFLFIVVLGVIFLYLAKAWCVAASSRVAGSTGMVQSGASGRSLRLRLERCGGVRSADRMIGGKHCISSRRCRCRTSQ